jgi:hypothetical protein
VLVQELVAHDEVGGDEAAVGPQVGLVDEDLAAALEDEARRPRLGHPGAVDVAGLEQRQALGVLLRHDRHVAGAALVDLEALLREEVAKGDVCVLPVCGVAMRLPRSCSTLVISGFTTSAAPPEVAPATMRSASPLLLTKALMAGLGPMYVASIAPANSASTAAGPALKVCVVSFVPPAPGRTRPPRRRRPPWRG